MSTKITSQKKNAREKKEAGIYPDSFAVVF